MTFELNALSATDAAGRETAPSTVSPPLRDDDPVTVKVPTSASPMSTVIPARNSGAATKVALPVKVDVPATVRLPLSTIPAPKV